MDFREATLSQDRVGMLNNLVASLRDQGLFRNCLNCQEWVDAKPNDPREGCSLFKAMPPPRVIIVGCEKHTDLIPF